MTARREQVIALSELFNRCTRASRPRSPRTNWRLLYLIEHALTVENF